MRGQAQASMTRRPDPPSGAWRGRGVSQWNPLRPRRVTTGQRVTLLCLRDRRRLSTLGPLLAWAAGGPVDKEGARAQGGGKSSLLCCPCHLLCHKPAPLVLNALLSCQPSHLPLSRKPWPCPGSVWLASSSVHNGRWGHPTIHETHSVGTGLFLKKKKKKRQV